MSPLLIVLAVLGGALTFLLCRAAAQRVWLPNPVSARSAHKRPVSRAGGAVLCGVVLLLSVLSIAVSPETISVPLLALTLAAGLIGLLDDRRELGPRIKLLFLAVLSGVVAWRFGPMPDPPGIGLPSALGYALGFFWVLGFVNVFNFMDGLNGVAAGTGTVLLAGIAVLGGPGAPLGLLMLGPLIGFATINVARGAPFLGDAGSLALGVLIAGGALSAGPGFWVVAAGATPFVADAALTLLKRARRGADLLTAHNEHAYQRLAQAGMRHAGVAALYAVLAACGVGAVLTLGPGVAWVAVPVTALAWYAAVTLAARQLARSAEASASRSSA